MRLIVQQFFSIENRYTSNGRAGHINVIKVLTVFWDTLVLGLGMNLIIRAWTLNYVPCFLGISVRLCLTSQFLCVKKCQVIKFTTGWQVFHLHWIEDLWLRDTHCCQRLPCLCAASTTVNNVRICELFTAHNYILVFIANVSDYHAVAFVYEHVWSKCLSFPPPKFQKFCWLESFPARRLFFHI